ncbi:hypothetical protein N7520_007448 [Penicillium odoratum]|uniref:uncharacterized protein n=1 Tax=Penicillium odoratum TaxID=1167516 RepID=UPI0025488264|nr:uncharacterized protein N7520_007448 [Penicillium odoratum]KAJ5760292.1 hypothetical protein N7520_007448 [Penicillium odoratum]
MCELNSNLFITLYLILHNHPYRTLRMYTFSVDSGQLPHDTPIEDVPFSIKQELLPRQPVDYAIEIGPYDLVTLALGVRKVNRNLQITWARDVDAYEPGHPFSRLTRKFPNKENTCCIIVVIKRQTAEAAKEWRRRKERFEESLQLERQQQEQQD